MSKAIRVGISVLALGAAAALSAVAVHQSIQDMRANDLERKAKMKKAKKVLDEDDENLQQSS